VLVDAAATAGILEPPDRLAPAIAEAGRSWSNLASRWGDLAPPGARVEEPLARAAAAVRAAYRQITHDTTALATPEVIATRPGLTQATMATLRAIESSSEVAHVIAEKADTPNLTGPARALSLRAHNDVEAGVVANPPEGDVVWISPTDILARRNVPIPPPVRASLCTASAAAESTSRTAAATAGLTIANAFGVPLDVAATPPVVDPTPRRGRSPVEPAPSQHRCGGGPTL
jgi:hypothetical protein